ncbi:hypothetical protein BJP27_24535 (plasmid) [Pseudomonas oryzihabitans]|nr:hypothetical protein BJP27_23885 [Pseudomonas psychrotolerans]APQ14739.1 hypothetical protein BJP27_24535 [Pseudomonas psychrotolerans]
MPDAHPYLSPREALAYADGQAYREELARLNAEDAQQGLADLEAHEPGAFARDCAERQVQADLDSAIRIPKALDAMASLLASGNRQRIVIK